MRILVAVIAFLASSALAACGGGSSSAPVPPADVVGLWVLDATMTSTAEGTPTPDGEIVSRASAGSEYSLQLDADRTFQLSLLPTSGGIVVMGSWTHDGLGVRLTPLTANGLPIPQAERQEDTASVDGNWLVLREAGRDMYLRRR